MDWKKIFTDPKTYFGIAKTVFPEFSPLFNQAEGIITDPSQSNSQAVPPMFEAMKKMADMLAALKQQNEQLMKEQAQMRQEIIELKGGQKN